MRLQKVTIFHSEGCSEGDVSEYIDIANTEDAMETLFLMNEYKSEGAHCIVEYGTFKLYDANDT